MEVNFTDSKNVPGAEPERTYWEEWGGYYDTPEEAARARKTAAMGGGKLFKGAL
jgi:hypothetical protein